MTWKNCSLYQYKNWFEHRLALQCVESLNNKGFTAVYAQNKQHAVDFVLKAIPNETSTIGIGGSVTIRDLNLPEILNQKGFTLYDHWDNTLTKEKKNEVRHKQITADVFLSSVNALCIDGTLINSDGFGNRVSSMIFGPQITIVVCGINKLVYSLDEAFRRIGRYAAPINSRRLGSPISVQNIISDSRLLDPDLGCRITTIIQKPPLAKNKFVVVLINEILGY